MSIFVDVDREGIVEFSTDSGMVKMIPFTGRVTGSVFSGIIEPWGVDTQVTNANDVRHMSARYILTGEDYTGEKCHIYVENNAWLCDGNHPRPFRTVPTFMTDSAALKPFLCRNAFVGEGLRDETGLWIRFYELEGEGALC